MNILTTEQLYIAAPSLFTKGAAEHTSERYKPIATFDVIDRLLKEGFYPTTAKQSVARSKERTMFAKHMVRFRHRDYHNPGNGLFPELVLINSHDGLSSYRLMAGLYRQICTNGLVAGKSYDEVRVKHQGDVIGNVIEGTYRVIESSQKMLQMVHHMENCLLAEEKLLEFSIQAHALRFSDEANLVIEPRNLLTPRRREDIKRDLFSVFNVVQENLIKGGIPGYRLNEYGRWRRARSRKITSIDQNVKINRDLWAIAENTLLSC